MTLTDVEIEDGARIYHPSVFAYVDENNRKITQAEARLEAKRCQKL